MPSTERIDRARTLLGYPGLGALRLRAGLSQTQLATKLGVSQVAVSRWENGHRTPNDELTVRAVETLTAAAKPNRHRITGLTLEEINTKADKFGALCEQTADQIILDRMAQWGDVVGPDDLNGLEAEWNKAVDGSLTAEVEQAFLDGYHAVRQEVKATLDRALVADAAEILTSLQPGIEGARNPDAEAYMADATNRLRHVSDLRWESARLSLHQGLAYGDSIPTIADNLRSGLEVGASRATVIARTEIIGASNMGQQTMMNKTGLPYTKTWLATGDNRTRPSHADADGQTVNQNEPYLVGGCHLIAPGIGACPQEITQCRCSETYEIGGDDLLGDYYDAGGQDEWLTGDDAIAHFERMVTKAPTQAQQDGLLLYAGSGYRDLNRKLRGQLTEVLTAKEAAALKEIKTLAATMRTTSATVVYRGVGNVDAVFPGNTVGAVLQDKGLMSTSVNVHAAAGRGSSAFDGQGIMEIRIPAGTSAVPMDAALRRPGDPVKWGFEEEVLLMPDTKLKVIAESTRTFGKLGEYRYLIAEVVP